MAAHVERKSGMAVLCKMSDRTASEVQCSCFACLSEASKRQAKERRMQPWQGSASHREFGAKLRCKIYFADPHAPWQRGANEKFNGLLRQFFPNEPLAAGTQEDLDEVARLLNRRPRRGL